MKLDGYTITWDTTAAGYQWVTGISGDWYGEAMKELQPKESEKPKVETTKDWAEKWAKEQGLDEHS